MNAEPEPVDAPRSADPGPNDSELVGEGAAQGASDAVEPGARLVDLDGAQEILGTDAAGVMELVDNGSLAPAPASGEDLLFRFEEVEVVRIERL